MKTILLITTIGILIATNSFANSRSSAAHQVVNRIVNAAIQEYRGKDTLAIILGSDCDENSDGYNLDICKSAQFARQNCRLNLVWQNLKMDSKITPELILEQKQFLVDRNKLGAILVSYDYSLDNYEKVDIESSAYTHLENLAKLTEQRTYELLNLLQQPIRSTVALALDKENCSSK